MTLTLKMVAPLLMVVGANCAYHICAKSMPAQINPFGALTVTYLVATICAAVLLAIGVGPANMGSEMAKINWVPIVMGLVIVFLEAGYILMYRSGWNVSVGAMTGYILVAVALLAIGFLLFKEAVSVKQVAGIVVCAVGLFLISS